MPANGDSWWPGELNRCEISGWERRVQFATISGISQAWCVWVLRHVLHGYMGDSLPKGGDFLVLLCS